MNLFKILLTYIETIVNILSNALVQTFLVYTTVVLIYKFFIEEQTTNYIPTFVTEILNKVRKTYTELDYATNQYGTSNKEELENIYNKLTEEESLLHQKNKEHNKNVINDALKMSFFILITFILFTIVTSRMSINIYWYQLLLSAVITVFGTLYEYFFITQVIVKYNFIELTKIYDTMAEKMSQLSDKVIKGNLVGQLKEITKKTGVNNVNTNQLINNMQNDMHNDIDNLVKNKGMLQNALFESDLVEKVGNTLNDMDHNQLKNSI
jgi:hypothetical protein